LCNLIIYILIPNFIFPKDWVIGDTDEDYWYEEKINNGTISWSLTVGLFS